MGRKKIFSNGKYINLCHLQLRVSKNLLRMKSKQRQSRRTKNWNEKINFWAILMSKL